MAEITATKTNWHYRLEVDGHARSHDACVMISAIVQTLVGAVRNNPDVDVHYETLEPGHAMVEYLSRTETGEEDMRLTVIGLLQVQNTFPEEDIKITENIFSYDSE